MGNIFHPCVFYEYKEQESSQNHYNCPIVVSYAENLKNNVEDLSREDARYLRPFIALTDEKTAADRLVPFCKETWEIPESEVRNAFSRAWNEQRRAKEDIRAEGQRALRRMESNGKNGIVLAGRPYHIDPEINHSIPELIASYGLSVFTEDSLPIINNPQRPLRVLDQWVYHSRLYNAAEFVSARDDLELVQLNSFGCGLDAVTSDQVSEILEREGAEAVVPDLMDFMNYSIYNADYKYRFLGAKFSSKMVASAGVKLIRALRYPALKSAYPQANIVAVDYDPGASEVNQLNRIKLMLSTAAANLK